MARYPRISTHPFTCTKHSESITCVYAISLCELIWEAYCVPCAQTRSLRTAVACNQYLNVSIDEVYQISLCALLWQSNSTHPTRRIRLSIWCILPSNFNPMHKFVNVALGNAYCVMESLLLSAQKHPRDSTIACNTLMHQSSPWSCYADDGHWSYIVMVAPTRAHCTYSQWPSVIDLRNLMSNSFLCNRNKLYLKQPLKSSNNFTCSRRIKSDGANNVFPEITTNSSF